MFTSVKSMNESRFWMFFTVISDLHNLQKQDQLRSIANPRSPLCWSLLPEHIDYESTLLKLPGNRIYFLLQSKSILTHVWYIYIQLRNSSFIFLLVTYLYILIFVDEAPAEETGVPDLAAELDGLNIEDNLEAFVCKRCNAFYKKSGTLRTQMR